MLEVCAGTGRNLSFYDFGEKKSWVEGMLGKGGALSSNRTGKRQEKQQQSTTQMGVTAAEADNDDDDDDEDSDKVTELICIDRSAAMLDIARAQWAKLHPPSKTNEPDGNADPISSKVTFLTQPADAPLPTPSYSSSSSSTTTTIDSRNSPKFDTTIQTLALCSLPSPTLHLLHLASLTDPHHGQILLLEHGRSDYTWVNWILDRAARRHAERHGCWFNRDISGVLKECEDAGVLVVEEVRRPVWGFGTVWFVRARVGGKLGGRGRLSK